jgi:hypothetical protein
MSAANGITEFLSELSESESLSALRQAHNQKSGFIFKPENSPTAIKCFIESFSDKRAILSLENNDAKYLNEKEASLKFNIGTEVYFVKALIKTHLNRYYFDMNSKVIQLKRRKEPRFFIPANWNQTARLVTREGDIVCKVLDISLSGIRFEIMAPLPAFQRDDITKIKFQIHKRAEVQSTAIVRFALNRPNFNQIIGMEFSAEITAVQKERVASLVEDIKAIASTTLK